MSSSTHIDLAGRSVVVTGAARGIGRALALRLAAAGARVTVNDLDEDGARQIAEEVQGLAVPGDCATEAGIAEIVERAARAHGPVDIYFGNAGVSAVGGLQAPEEVWASALEVNLMAQVRTARVLVPAWLDRGRGRLVITASAAGLLTMPGAAAYSASKHAVVAFAEWLSMTYRDRGLVVQVVCPQAVETEMLEGMGALADVARQTGAIEPSVVADVTLEALADDRFLILPHPEVHRFYVHRATDTDRWLSAMNSGAR